MEIRYWDDELGYQCHTQANWINYDECSLVALSSSTFILHRFVTIYFVCRFLYFQVFAKIIFAQKSKINFTLSLNGFVLRFFFSCVVCRLLPFVVAAAVCCCYYCDQVPSRVFFPACTSDRTSERAGKQTNDQPTTVRIENVK